MTVRAATMASSAPDAVLLVEALSIVQHGLPGPALGGRTGIQIVASVVRSDGTPAASLPAQAFEVYAVAGAVNSAPNTLGIRTARETVPGIYTLSLEAGDAGANHERQVFALIVHESSGSRRQGRTLVRIDV